jgi:hypothetical protein
MRYPLRMSFPYVTVMPPPIRVRFRAARATNQKLGQPDNHFDEVLPESAHIDMKLKESNIPVSKFRP